MKYIKRILFAIAVLYLLSLGNFLWINPPPPPIMFVLRTQNNEFFISPLGPPGKVVGFERTENELIEGNLYHEVHNVYFLEEKKEPRLAIKLCARYEENLCELYIESFVSFRFGLVELPHYVVISKDTQKILQPGKPYSGFWGTTVPYRFPPGVHRLCVIPGQNEMQETQTLHSDDTNGKN